jgi:hypothetical protein
MTNKKWQPAGGAQWKFYWILGGTAIQDDWISPAPDKPAPKVVRQYGSNIRIFNAKLKRWEMAWAANNGGEIDTFNAVAEGKSVVMSGFSTARTRVLHFLILSQNPLTAS